MHEAALQCDLAPELWLKLIFSPGCCVAINLGIWSRSRRLQHGTHASVFLCLINNLTLSDYCTTPQPSAAPVCQVLMNARNYSQILWWSHHQQTCDPGSAYLRLWARVLKYLVCKFDFHYAILTLRLGNVSKLYQCCDMRQDIFLDFGCIIVLWYVINVVFSWF